MLGNIADQIHTVFLTKPDRNYRHSFLKHILNNSV